MYLNNTISRNQVKHLSRPTKFFNKAEWNRLKKPQYEWARIEGARYKPSVALTLQALVACCNESGKTNASIQAITAKRAKIVPGRPVKQRTISNHLRILSIGKTIKRGIQKFWNATVRTALKIKKILSRTQYAKNSNLYLNPLKGVLDYELHPPPP